MSYVDADLQQFITNMDSLSFPFDIVSESKNDNSFLLGTLWSGVLGAYEGFVHNLFERLMQKSSFQHLAIEKIKNLNDKDKNHLRYKPNYKVDKEYLVPERKPCFFL